MSDNAEKVKKPFYKKWWFWLIVVLFIFGSIGSCGDDGDDSSKAITASETDTVVVEETNNTENIVEVADEPEPTVYEVLVFDFTIDEWLANLNIWQDEIDEPHIPSYEKEDITFTATLSDYVVYMGQLTDSDEIVSMIMIGVGDGSVESGVDILLGMGGLITSVQPNYGPDERRVILEGLGILQDNLPDETTSTIKDGIEYTFMSSTELGIMMFASPSK